MRKFWVIICFVIVCILANGQVRNGWRSIYDKEGRLTQMHYYKDGIHIPDSSYFFQYYADNYLKAVVTGEIVSQANNNIDGRVCLFDYSGKITSYHQKVQGQLVYAVDCDYEESCSARWQDLFDVDTKCWTGDNSFVQDGDFVLHNDATIAVAEFTPKVPVNLKEDFICKLVIPVEKNSARLGLALGWKDTDNFYLFEISYGKYYSVYYWQDGNYHTLSDGRQEIEKQNEEANEIKIRKTIDKLIFEVNENIEMVLPCPDFAGDKIALINRARGDARFDEFAFEKEMKSGDPFFRSLWKGQGTGFFISPTKILTTYDEVADKKVIRVRGEIDNKPFVLPVTVFRLEEENNLAILSVNDPDFKPFDILPFGYTNHVPISESKVFTVGFPDAICAKQMVPEVFEGKILPNSTLYSGSRLLEMSFRYGMTGAPVFDNDANLIGVCATKGIDLQYTEIIDFYDNARLFKANMGKLERRLESPVKDQPYEEKMKALSNVVVIVESCVFDVE